MLCCGRTSEIETANRMQHPGSSSSKEHLLQAMAVITSFVAAKAQLPEEEVDKRTCSTKLILMILGFWAVTATAMIAYIILRVRSGISDSPEASTKITLRARSGISDSPEAKVFPDKIWISLGTGECYHTNEKCQGLMHARQVQVRRLCKHCKKKIE